MGRARLPVLALTLVLALLAAPAARTAALDLDSILRESSYSAADKEKIRSIFAQADRQRIPRDLLLPRLAEGTVKRVGLPRLTEVLEGYLGHLGAARTILEAATGGKALLEDRAAWSLTATLLETGAGEQEIQDLAAAAEGKAAPYRNGELLYASLVSWGASRTAALQVTLAAMRSELPADQFPGLINLFEQGRQKRISPERVAGRIIDSLPGVRNIDDLRRAVLY